MAANNIDELDYYATVLKKISNKKYEFFVISRIISLLNDREIEFTTQQLIRTAKGRFLLDLYFPQLKLAIEVDESYHSRDNQVAKDKEREKAVVDVSQVEIERVNASGQSFDDVISRIDALVSSIKEKKKELKHKKQFTPFVYGDKYKTEKWLKKGVISIADDARFKTHVDAAKIFGKNYDGHQRAVINLDEGRYVWFPKLYENGDWDNTLSSDGKKIEQKRVAGGRYDLKKRKKERPADALAFVFAHHKDDFGQVYYAFKGVFQVKSRKDGVTQYIRCYDAIKFDGKGNVTPFNKPA